SSYAAFERLTDNPGDVLGLIVERLGCRGVEATLKEPHVELIWKSGGIHAVQLPKPVCPMILKKSTPAARPLVDPPPPRKVTCHLETAGENQAVDFIFRVLVD